MGLESLVCTVWKLQGPEVVRVPRFWVEACVVSGFLSGMRLCKELLFVGPRLSTFLTLNQGNPQFHSLSACIPGTSRFEYISTLQPSSPPGLLSLGSPVVPFYPFSFWAPLLKPNSRKKATLIIKGLLGNLGHSCRKHLAAPTRRRVPEVWVSTSLANGTFTSLISGQINSKYFEQGNAHTCETLHSRR